MALIDSHRVGGNKMLRIRGYIRLFVLILFCAEPLLAITLSEIAPDFSLTNLHGRKVQLSALHVRTAMPPCQSWKIYPSSSMMS
ncbi:MAG: hypothetical protein ACYTDW_18805 [Planctomycetota bacterium]